MRRYSVAALATAVAASLIAPQAILAEQPSPAPAPDGGGSAPRPSRGAKRRVAAPTARRSPTAPQRSPAPARPRDVARPPASRRATASARPAATVAMQDFYFSPKTVTIDAGETIKWDNKGKAEEGHTATGDSFDSAILKQGETYTHKFATVGTFDYICTLHPSMKGTVVVKAKSGGGGGGGGRRRWRRAARMAGDRGAAAAAPARSGDSGSSFGAILDSSGSGSSGSLPSTGLDWRSWRCSESICSWPAPSLLLRAQPLRGSRLVSDACAARVRSPRCSPLTRRLVLAACGSASSSEAARWMPTADHRAVAVAAAGKDRYLGARRRVV